MLLAGLKIYLNISWDDALIDRKLEDLLAVGEAYLTRLIGVPLDFEADAEARGLLYDYVRYAYNHAADEFETAYAMPIRRMIIERGATWTPKST